jgi:hypothetical protein
MKRYCKITTNTPDETVVTGLSEPWILLDKSETGKDNFIFQRSINNLTLDLEEGNIDDVKLFVKRDKEHALMCIKNKDNTYTVIYKKEKTELSQDYPVSIYQYCKNIILPNSITKINLETFKNCTYLENITLPNSISEIGDKVFFGCTNLKTVKIPNRVKRISNDLFNGCTQLEQVYIPSNIHDIRETAFNECINLKEVILYNGLTNNEEHFTPNENGEINIPYYDENGEQKTIGININNNTKPEEWELNPLTPDNNVILYKTSKGNRYNFDGGANTSYVEGYTVNDDGTNSPIVKLDIVNHDEASDFDGYRIEFTQNTNIAKIIGGLSHSGVKQWFYFESTDLTEIYLPVSVTDINNCVFCTPNLSTLLLPPNISLKQCKLPDDEENGVYDRYVEVLFNCGKLKNILYNGTSKEFMDIISSEDTASRTWYKDLPHEFTVTCLDKKINLTNNFKSEDDKEYESIIKQNDNEILYKAPYVSGGNYDLNYCDGSINLIDGALTPTGNNYNILQFNYGADGKVFKGRYDAGMGGHEFYCIKSDMITELVLPNGVEEIDALAFKCDNLTTVTLPSSIKRFKSVTYDNWLLGETVTRTLIFGPNIKTIYFDGTINEWNAIYKNIYWLPEGKTITVICHNGQLSEVNIEEGGTTSSDPDSPGGTTSDNVGDSTSDNNDGPNIPGGSEDIGDSTSDNNDGPEGGDNTGDSTSDNNDGPEGGDNTGDSTSDNNDGPEGGDNTGDSTSDNNDGPEGGDNTGESTSDNNDGPEGGDDTGESTSSNNEEGEDGDDTGESTSDNNDGPDSIDDTNFNETEYDPNINEPGTKEYGERDIIL